MLVKMALSKSTIKRTEKTHLYFNKYVFKAAVTTTGIHWIKVCKDINRFIELVQQRYDEWETSKDRYPNGWYRQPKHAAEHDLGLIEDVINIRISLIGSDVRFRFEHETFSIYTNDDKLIKKLSDNKAWKIEQADVSPPGIKYFKKDPPAKYRAYMTSSKIKSEFCQEMVEYLGRTSDLEPSNAFVHWLHRRNSYSYSHVWLWNNHFIDYNDERNLMMMKLLFPDAIGKTYKLEKKS